MEETTMNNEIMDNNFVDDDVTIDSNELIEYSDENDGLPVGAIIGGVLGTAAVATVAAAAVKNKDKIKNKAAEVKAALKQKKLEKLEKKAMAIEEAKKKYIEIDETK